MTSFNTQNTAINNCHNGDTIAMQSAVAAADAGSVGTYHVRIFIMRLSDNAIVHDKYFYSQSLTQTPTNFSENWVNNLALGNYRYGCWVYNTAYSIMSSTQTYRDFSIVSPLVATTIEKVSGDNVGALVGNTVPYLMVACVKDQNGAPMSGVSVSWVASAGTLLSPETTTDQDGTVVAGFAAPAGSPQKSTITVTSGSAVAVFEQTSHNPTYLPVWKVPTFRPANPPIDALAGGGFLPDDGKAYTSIIQDEFNGSALDLTKWKKRYIYNNGTLDFLNDELERYVDNHIVSDGTLKLTAHARPGTTGHAPSPSGDTYPLFDSSMIRSITTFKRGYFEIRAKMPPGMGVWPAFWINPQIGWPPEIDILEYVRNNTTELPTMMHHNVHPTQRYLFQDLNTNTQYAYWRAPASLDPNYFTSDWHVYGCLWDEWAATFHIDGVTVASVRCPWLHGDGSDGGMAHLLLNLAMGGSWPTNNWTSPVALDDQVFEIDYVRGFQRSDAIITGTATV